MHTYFYSEDKYRITFNPNHSINLKAICRDTIYRKNMQSLNQHIQISHTKMVNQTDIHM